MGNTKDIRTLVICKVNPDWTTTRGETDYTQIYQELIGSERGGQSFITLGGPDAICIYKTPIQTNNVQWLVDVLDDKQFVISSVSPSISYHPIHVVSEARCDDFWSSTSTSAFLLVTFLYGVERPLNAGEQIKKELRTAGFDSVEKHFAVYRSINISDFVVFLTTDDLALALNALSAIDKQGIARRIFTTVNLALADGQIDSRVLQKLPTMPGNIGVSIQGTIRSIREWKDTVQKTAEELGLTARIHYGAVDFSVRGDLDGPRFKRLLLFFMKNSKRLSVACWDIHTEIQTTPGSKEDGSGASAVPSLVKPEYELFLRKRSAVERQPWYYHYTEMMFTQMNQDSHPLLSGPAHMFYDSIHVANSILFDRSPEQLDITDPDDRIARSQFGIERFIRCANQLTDQLTRNDDVLFHGLGRTPSIVSALPEMMLEFYHSFFRELAELLTDLDPKGPDIEPFQYGFILAPKINERMRISPMFRDDVRFKKLPRGGALQHWPSKQVFIIQFPADDIYKPMTCVIPLVHECFHFFGDSARLRKVRYLQMSCFIAATFLSSLKLDRSHHRELFYSVLRILLDVGPTYDLENVYGEEAQQIFEKKLDYLLSEDGLMTLYERNGRPSYLFTQENLDRWLSVKYGMDNASRPVSYIRLCIYLFRECQADLLALEVLALTPGEYLEQIIPEFHALRIAEQAQSEQDTESQRMVLCQRVAVVLTAYCSSPLCVKEYESDDEAKKHKQENSTRNVEREQRCQQAIEAIWGTEPEAADLILRYLTSIMYPSAPAVSGESAIPTAALRYASEYLMSVRYYFDKAIQRSMLLIKKRNDLKNAFDETIRNCDMFGETFYKIIETQRQNVRTRAARNASGSDTA